MDVEMQMDAQGYDWSSHSAVWSRELTYPRLPTTFESTSDQSEKTHIASNIAASMANAETPIAPIPEQKQVPPEVPVTEATLLEADTTQATEVSAGPNGILHDTAPAMQNGVSAINLNDKEDLPVPDSQPLHVDAPLPEPSQLEPAPTTSNTSFEESVIPSSIPAEIQPSPPSTDPTQTTMESIAAPLTLSHPPTSDLRSSPHADALTPGQVAQIEEQKHEVDNAAAEPEVTSTSAPVESIVVSSLPTISDFATDSSKVNVTGLATPTQSPPPAPQPEPATLPVNPPPVPATEVPEPAVVPLEQPTDGPLVQDEPEPAPAEPASAPAEPESMVESQEDQIMTDVISPPVKLTREREEDQDEEPPAAKRVKTDVEQADTEQSEFKVPEAPAAASPTPVDGTPTPAGAAGPDGDDTVTQPRLAHMKKVISNLKKSNASQAFRIPVDPVAMNIPSYPEIVKTPMDLGTIDTKLKQGTYQSVSDFTSDFELIVDNCIKFNGREHVITQAALKMQSSFNNQMANLPKAGFAEPSKEEKRAAKAKQEPTRTAPPRRPSVSTTVPPAAPTAPATGSARSPRSSVSTQAFAVGPDGVPLIRRDSNMADGRPKRQIVPPKRNQEYQGGRPKKKKYELQLKFCQDVMKEIAAPKNWQMNQYFTHPVDPVALNIPTYFQVVKKPMDLSTIQNKLDNNVYEKAKDFEEDVRLVFKNCYKFNPEGDHVNACGHQLEELFNKRWAGKDEWIASREPASEPVSDDEEEDEESEDDGEDSEAQADRDEKIASLQKAIAEMSRQVGDLSQPKKKKKSKSPSSQAKKSKSKSSKKEKPKASFPGLQKTEKKKSVSKTPKEQRDRYVTFAEKQYISNGIAMLPENQMQEALRIIQQSVPSLAHTSENEIELDIEEVPNHALLQLLQFVKKYAGPPPDEPKSEADAYAAPSGKPVKSKTMTKKEQEQEIKQLQGKLHAYNRGPVSPNALQSIENGDSSDDDGDSEESEEE